MSSDIGHLTWYCAYIWMLPSCQKPKIEVILEDISSSLQHHQIPSNLPRVMSHSIEKLRSGHYTGTHTEKKSYVVPSRRWDTPTTTPSITQLHTANICALQNTWTKYLTDIMRRDDVANNDTPYDVSNAERIDIGINRSTHKLVTLLIRALDKLIS
eukprot:9349714-Ditylum_brightwellii.AAC.1